MSLEKRQAIWLISAILALSAQRGPGINYERHGRSQMKCIGRAAYMKLVWHLTQACTAGLSPINLRAMQAALGAEQGGKQALG